jgi:hypothetical protein
MKYVLILMFSLVANSAFGASRDTGKVTTVYANPDGSLAFKLDGGFPNSNANNECPGNTGWVGIGSTDPFLKSMVMAAKVANMDVEVVISGCHNSWLKIQYIYVL